MIKNQYLDGARFVTASSVAADFDLHPDYISRLARQGKIRGKLLRRNWYVDEESLKSYIIQRAYEREVRKESLSKERLLEYEKATKGCATQERADFPSSIRNGLQALNTVSSPSKKEETTLSALEELPFSSRSLHALLNAPTGLAHAAIQTTHAPGLVTPLVEFVHKLIALTFAVSITFGTFALLNPQSTRVAHESVVESLSEFEDSFSRIVSKIALEYTEENISQTASVRNSGFPEKIAVVITIISRMFDHVASLR